MSLVARYLEEHGIPTVVIGSARDIVEHCAVPRFLFTDFPLGNPCGHPHDRAMQREIVRLGLTLLETATKPCVTARTPYEWKDDPGWRERYNRVDDSNRAKLLAIGDARRKNRGQAARE